MIFFFFFFNFSSSRDYPLGIHYQNYIFFFSLSLSLSLSLIIFFNKQNKRSKHFSFPFLLNQKTVFISSHQKTLFVSSHLNNRGNDSRASGGWNDAGDGQQVAAPLGCGMSAENVDRARRLWNAGCVSDASHGEVGLW